LTEIQMKNKVVEEHIESIIVRAPPQQDLRQRVASSQAFVYIAQCLYHPRKMRQLKLTSKLFEKRVTVWLSMVYHGPRSRLS